ncbi:MAG: class I SAM-dependent methyltransferase [Clostridiales bacterium]|nr:class I SAM-dependent methyltransferase [Clostridiales bacterium]
MPVIQGLGWTFDTAAAAYEKFRPGYVDELYQTLFDYLPIGKGSHALEVGIGGGQATLPVLETGCQLTAIEPGKNFCALCRDKFKEYPDFQIVQGKFEDVPLPENHFDLIYSASAFHWVPEEQGYAKAYSLLKKGGAFARFANHPYPDKERLQLTDAIQACYDRFYTPFHKRGIGAPAEYSAEAAKNRAMIAEKYGFADIRWALYHRTRTFTAEEYVQLLGTYSDHIALEESVRREFFAAIRDAINEHGGLFTIYDTIDLQLARKL